MWHICFRRIRRTVLCYLIVVVAVIMAIVITVKKTSKVSKRSMMMKPSLLWSMPRVVRNTSLQW
ncbi:MAG: hypothetical protein J6Y58_01170 [Clostridiales bacterium]|nr:hypothetical protein [Clostridiales bacterium]